MATARKSLGQALPAATTDTVLVAAVPASHDYVLSSIVVAETNAVAATFRICVRPGGGTTTTAGTAVAWNVAIPANGVVTLALGICMAATDTVVVQASTANVAFSAFGQDNS